jgi:hypothetical protein
MANTKKVRILSRVGDPTSGAIIAPGALVDLPEVWADRYIANGSAELVAEKPKAKADDAKPKAKKK